MAPLAGSPHTPVGWTPATAPAASRSSIDWGSAARGVVPYISNIANSFRRVPAPPIPKLTSTVTPQRVSYAAARAEALRRMRGENLGLDENLDENTAAAVKAANLASSINAENLLNEREQNTNAQLRSEADRLNAGIRSRNDALTNEYRANQVAAEEAQQRTASANLSNAADKYIAEGDEQRKAALDLDKLKVYSQIWKNSGVYDRILAELEKEGVDPTGTQRFLGRTPVYAAGGAIDPGDRLKAAKEKAHAEFPRSLYPYSDEHPQRSDSAAYVYGYMDDSTPQQRYPIGWEENAPVQEGYQQHWLDSGHTLGELIKAARPKFKLATGGPVNPLGPGDPPMSDNDIYQNYASQLKGNPDASRLASVLTVADKYGVSPASVYTSTTTAHDGSMPRRRTFTIIEKGKPRRTITQDLAGSAAGSDGNTPFTSEPIASFATGGGIHIKPSHVGRFTAYKKRTGKTTEEALHSKDPHVRQMANFARNFAH